MYKHATAIKCEQCAAPDASRYGLCATCTALWLDNNPDCLFCADERAYGSDDLFCSEECKEGQAAHTQWENQ